MKKIVKKLKASDVELLSSELGKLSILKKLPIKRCVALNAEMIRNKTVELIDKKRTLVDSFLLLDEKGEYVTKQGFSGNIDNAPLDAFMYQSDKSPDDLNNKLNELNNSEHELEFYSELKSREVFVSNGNGEYSRVPLISILEDPNNDLSPKALLIFEKYMLHNN